MFRLWVITKGELVYFSMMVRTMVIIYTRANRHSYDEHRLHFAVHARHQSVWHSWREEKGQDAGLDLSHEDETTRNLAIRENRAHQVSWRIAQNDYG